MRWSQFCCLLAVLLALAVDSVLSRPIPLHSPEQWAPIIARSPGTTKASSLKTSNYRKTAIKSGLLYDRKRKQAVQTSFSKAQLKKLDADHLLEAQTVAKTLDKHDITLTADQHKDVRKILNGPENLVMVDKGMNRRKGAFNRAVLAGKDAELIPEDKEYMHKSAPRIMSVSQKADKVVDSKQPKKQSKNVNVLG